MFMNGSQCGKVADASGLYLAHEPAFLVVPLIAVGTKADFGLVMYVV